MQLDRTIVSNYRVVGDTTIGGERAVRVRRVTSSKATGAGNMQASAMNLEMNSAGTGTYFVTTRGAFLGGTSSDDITTRITVLPQNIQIGVKQSAETRINQIK